MMLYIATQTKRDMAELASKGVNSFKFFMAYKVRCGVVRLVRCGALRQQLLGAYQAVWSGSGSRHEYDMC